MLASKNVTINGENFTVMEISIGAMLPILPKLQGSDAQEAQFDMLKQCVLLDGVLMGESLMQLGLASYMKLAKEVMDINGLAGEELGND